MVKVIFNRRKQASALMTWANNHLKALDEKYVFLNLQKNLEVVVCILNLKHSFNTL